MADPRFFKVSGPFPLEELARIGGGELSEGSDPDRLFADVAPLDRAGPSDISFLDNKRYRAAFVESKAGACIVAPALASRAPVGMALLTTPTPYKAYALVAQAFYPRPTATGAIHETAVIAHSAQIGEGTDIGAYSVIGAEVMIGEGCGIGAQVVIDAGVEVGARTTIGHGVTLSYCTVGADCQIHAGVRIGNRGFGFALDPEEFVDVPQLGRVIVGDNVEVGANATIDRGAGSDTVIGEGTRIDNLVQIGHNVRLGQACVLVAQSGISGSAELKDRVMIAGQSGVAGHLKMGAGSRLASKSGLMRDLPSGQTVCGVPAIPIRDFFRLNALWRRQLKALSKSDE